MLPLRLCSCSLLAAIDSNFDGHVSFDEFVNGFAAVSEWSLLTDLKRKRADAGVDEPVMPFTFWVP